MGRVYTFDLATLRIEYGLSYYVETGCGLGDSLQSADHAGFSRLYACDIDKKAIEIIERRSLQTPSELHCMPSEHFLSTLSLSEPAFYWLDAHIPGEMTTRYDTDTRTCFPLAHELQILSQASAIAKSVIICDDARLYWDMDFQDGNCHERPNADPIEPALGLFANTHQCHIDLRHEGYIILKPI